MPDILARVNGQPVTTRQVVPLAKKAIEKEGALERDKKKPRVMRAALQDYIDRELLLAEALTRGLRADDRAVQSAYDRARVEHPDDKDWAEQLSFQGFDPQSYKNELRAEETIKALLREIASHVLVTDEEARARYEARPEEFPAPPGAQADFTVVKEDVKARILEEKSQPRLRELITALRAKARIETYI
jgi:predicted transcriptional regulator